MKRYLSRSVLFLFFSVCALGPRIAVAAPLKPYTVLIYLNGTDLESTGVPPAGTRSLRELMSFGSSDALNLVVETGGTKRWHNKVVSPDFTQRWFVSPDFLTQVDNRRLGQQNMAEPAPLTDFIVWGVNRYPAQRYVLILWDHGWGPIEGFGQDETNGKAGNDAKRLKISDLASAIATARARIMEKTGGNFEFELIGFDTCLLGSLEVAWKLRRFAKFMVASEHYEVPSAWNYKTFEVINSDPSISGNELGRRIVDGYMTKARRYGFGESHLTASVTDLKMVQSLTSRLGRVAEQLDTAIDGQWAALSKARDEALELSGNSYDLVDVADLMRALSRRNVLDDAEATAVLDALGNAIDYNRTNDLWKRAKGLSVYFPHIKEDRFDKYLGIYKGLGFVARYESFAARYAARRLADKEPVPLVQDMPKRVSGKALTYGIRIDPGDGLRVRRICATLKFIENQRWQDKQDCNGVRFDERSGGISYAFDQRWPSLNGHTVEVDPYAGSLFLGDGLIEYPIPVRIHQRDGFHDAVLPAIYDEKARAYRKIETAQLQTPGDIDLSKADVVITPDTRIRLKNLELGPDGLPVDPPRYVVGPEFVVGNAGLVLEDAAVPPGRYRIGFELSSVNGTSTFSKLVPINYQ